MEYTTIRFTSFYLIILIMLCCDIVESRTRHEYYDGHRKIRTTGRHNLTQSNVSNRKHPLGDVYSASSSATMSVAKEKKPNIILILTDDQDVELGMCFILNVLEKLF